MLDGVSHTTYIRIRVAGLSLVGTHSLCTSPSKMVTTLGKSFHCSFVYAVTDKKERTDLFGMLETLAQSASGPWMVIGDLNCVANINERIGQPVRISEVLPLRRCMDHCDLHDMKSTGRLYTWNNKQFGGKRVFSKIDRSLCNSSWEDQFPIAEASFLPEEEFDHSPILIHFFPFITIIKHLSFITFGLII